MPREPLEAIMLVGGKGTRLRPLTLSAPKPLLPTAGVPFLAHQLARAAECGITHVVLATSYRAEMFTEAFGDGAQFGLSIDYVYESTPLGTGGGIHNAAALLRGGGDEPIVVLNGDVLAAHDLPAQVDLHRKTEAAVTLHLVPVVDPSRYGCVPTDALGRVTAFLEKTPNPVTPIRSTPAATCSAGRSSTRYRLARSSQWSACLLYTSDAADDLLCVDLGGRRI